MCYRNKNSDYSKQAKKVATDYQMLVIMVLWGFCFILYFYVYIIFVGLYKKGFVYLDVPIHESDRIIVPPLEGFVMNRVLGDYFETLLYKIFVSLDEHTPIREVSVPIFLFRIHCDFFSDSTR